MIGKPEETQADQSFGRGKRLLVVDDEPAVRDALERVLVLEGYHVTTVANGDEVFEHLDERRVDLILLDINLAGESGLTICQAIRKTQPALAVIGITARPDQSSVAAAAGVTQLLEKPLDMSKLLDTIRRACC